MTASNSRPREHPPRWVRVADAAALLLFGLAVLAFLTGGVQVSVAGIPLSVTSPAHLLAEASAIVLFRVIIWRGAGALGSLAQVLAFGVFVVSLAGDSNPRRVGDAGEYMAMARQLGRLAGPTIAAGDTEYFTQKPWGEIEGYGAEDQGFDGGGQRRVFIHFWFYPLLAAPFVRLAEAAGVHPNWGFTALNALLLVGTFVVLIRRLDVAAALVLLCGPILWWIDKAHTEVFTFTMLSLGFAQLRDRPWWSMAAFGAASTQNPPIAIALGLALAWTALAGRWRDARVRLAAAVGIGLAVTAPLYYHWRLGLWFPLRRALVPHWPGFAECTAVLWDPNLGILLFAPFWTLAVATAAVVLAVRKFGRLVTPGLCCAVLAAGWFLFSFSQAANANSGATFGPSRYGLWLLPLAAPLFQQILDLRDRDRARWLRAAAVLALLWVPLVAQPRFGEKYVEPSRLASWLWTRWPSVDNPLPEVFTERLARRESDPTLPIGTPACEKALVVATASRGVLWPPQCEPQDVPPVCTPPGTLCYANRTGASYALSPAPSQPAYLYRIAEPDRR